MKREKELHRERNLLQFASMVSLLVLGKCLERMKESLRRNLRAACLLGALGRRQLGHSDFQWPGCLHLGQGVAGGLRGGGVIGGGCVLFG